MKRQLLTLVLPFLAAACASKIPHALSEDTRFLPNGGGVELHSENVGEARIRYLGVSGFVIDYKGSRVYTGPFYSNPHILNSFPFVPMKADETCIKESLPENFSDDGFEEPVVLVGHAHYDHLMDLPPLLKTQLDNTKVLGSLSTQRLINRSLGITTCGNESRAIAVEHNQTYKFGKVRISPVLSDHAPHLLGITAMTGEASCKGGTPSTAWGWKMGKVYAYIIDFLSESDEIEFRLFYQDSASDEGKLQLEKLNRKADVALIVMAGFHQVDNYPHSIANATNASLYVVGHWEDFFSGCHQTPPLITRGTSATRFMKEVEGKLDWRMLYPNTELTVQLKTKR